MPVKKTETQAERVLAHLQKYTYLKSTDAIALYGITRLAAVIHKLRIVYNITDVRKIGAKGGTYKEYSLVKAA